MKLLIQIILIILLTAKSINLWSQQNLESIKASLVYYFISYVNWPHEEKIDKYKIGVYSTNNIIYDELILMSKIKKVKEKPIEIIKVDDITNLPPHIQVLYVGVDYNDLLNEIFKSVSDKNILLISNNSKDRLFTMINFIVSPPNDSRIEFEANKQNLIAAGFTFRTELLLYGGTQVDIKELVTEAEKKLNFVLDSIKMLENEITAKEIELKQKNSTIDQLYKSINTYQTEIDKKNEQFLQVSEQITAKQNLLLEKNKELIIQKQQQQSIIKEIESKKDDLEKAENNLETLKKETSIQHQKINEQDQILSKQYVRLQSQKKQLYLIVSLLGASLIAAFTLLYSFQLKKRLYNELSQTNYKLIENKIELEQTIQKLKNTQNQLVQSEKMASIGMLTAGIAHEINNPINFINSGNDLLPEIMNEIENKIDKEDTQSQETLKKIYLIHSSIHTGVERTTEIISSLHNYVRFDGDKFSFHNITDSLRDAILILSNKHKDRIKINEEIDEIPLIECIPGKIYQVFLNLLSNSIDAIENEGDINIKIKNSADKTSVDCIISDNGTGIEQDHIPIVFDPFFTTKEVGKGTGLGLYIVYGIIEQHNGEIKIESDKGKGTMVKINLPVKHVS